MDDKNAVTIDIQDLIAKITAEVGEIFPTIGGGDTARTGSFISDALKDVPLSFTHGVRVDEVVVCVVEAMIVEFINKFPDGIKKQ